MSLFIRSPCMPRVSKICSESAKVVKSKKGKFKEKNSKKLMKVFLIFFNCKWWDNFSQYSSRICPGNEWQKT